MHILHDMEEYAFEAERLNYGKGNFECQAFEEIINCLTNLFSFLRISKYVFTGYFHLSLHEHQYVQGFDLF
jgi:hypothetical protein